MNRIIYILVLFLIFNCSSTNSNRDLENIVKIFNEMTKEVEFKTFTTEMFKDIDYPIIEIKTNGIIKQLLMLPVTQRENYYNYSSGSGQSLTFEDQFITKSNGFETHLLSMEFSRNLLKSFETNDFPFNIDKSYSFLTPDYKIKTMTIYH